MLTESRILTMAFFRLIGVLRLKTLNCFIVTLDIAKAVYEANNSSCFASFPAYKVDFARRTNIILFPSLARRLLIY